MSSGGVEIWQLLAFCAIAGGLFFWMRVENHFIRSNSTVDNTYIKIPAENNICGEDWSKLNLVPEGPDLSKEHFALKNGMDPGGTIP